MPRLSGRASCARVGEDDAWGVCRDSSVCFGDQPLLAWACDTVCVGYSRHSSNSCRNHALLQGSLALIQCPALGFWKLNRPCTFTLPAFTIAVCNPLLTLA